MRLRSGVTLSGTHSVTGVAQRGAEHRVGNAGIAGSRVENDLARRQLPAGQPLEDHPPGRPILDRPAGVPELGLSVQLDAGHVALDPAQANERSVTDEVDRSTGLTPCVTEGIDMCD